MPDPNIIEGAAGTGQLLRDSGGWGLSGLLLGALGLVVKWWRDEASGRLDDQKEMGRVLSANTLAQAEQTRAIESRDEAFRESVKSQELAVVADRAQAALLLEVKATVERAVGEQARVREALIAKGLVPP